MPFHHPSCFDAKVELPKFDPDPTAHVMGSSGADKVLANANIMLQSKTAATDSVLKEQYDYKAALDRHLRLEGSLDHDLSLLVNKSTYLHSLARELEKVSVAAPEYIPRATALNTLAGRVEGSARALAWVSGIKMPKAPPYLLKAFIDPLPMCWCWNRYRDNKDIGEFL